jgi:probable blue pigment (indigoidine) exporter
MTSMKRSSGAWTAGATVLAPITWGTTYVTITELLPAGRPLLVAAVRVVPSGLVLGAFASRWRPRGAAWWRTAVLALFNFGLFFPLLVVAVYRLPGGVAAAAGGLQPLVVATLSWPLAGRRPRPSELVVGTVAALGVGLVVLRPGADLDVVGLLAAVGANLSFAVGVVLTKRFPAPSNQLASTGWQLLLGGVILVPLTLLVEGTPPALSGRNLAGFAYLSVVGTGLAFVLWFRGIRRLPTAAPPLLGLAAPITGAVLGWCVLGQSLSPVQVTGFVVTVAAIAYGASLARQPTGHQLGLLGQVLLEAGHDGPLDQAADDGPLDRELGLDPAVGSIGERVEALGAAAPQAFAVVLGHDPERGGGGGQVVGVLVDEHQLVGVDHRGDRR